MKKIVGLFVMVVMMVMMAVSCTPNGAPLSLVGVWKSEVEEYQRIYDSETGTYIYSSETVKSTRYFEITDDDYVASGSTKEALEAQKQDKEHNCAKIIKATCNELHFKNPTQISDNQYMIYNYELAGDKLTLSMYGQVTVYTKD
jgi:hypothetical protein